MLSRCLFKAFNVLLFVLKYCSKSAPMFTHSMLFILFLYCKYDSFQWLLVHYFLCGFLSSVVMLPFVLWLGIKPGTHLSPLSANTSAPLTSVGVRWASHLSWWDLCSVIIQHPCYPLYSHLQPQSSILIYFLLIFFPAYSPVKAL